MTRLVIDPVTRVAGHLRIEVDVDGGLATDAWSSGTVFRGMERILEGRDAREAWLLAQRVCGTCTGAHALASVRAVENALGMSIPTNARLLRDIMAGTQFVLDHVLHFYQLQALDWVDVAAALGADPAATAAYLASTGESGATAASVTATRDRIAASVAAGGAGALATTFSGHPAYRLSPEAGLAILGHYLQALDWQRSFMRVQARIGGKSPHPQTFLVGGMAVAAAWGGPSVGSGEHPSLTPEEPPAALSDAGLAEMADLIAAARTFVEGTYLPDVLAVATAYADWSTLGVGIGNYLAYGEFPEDDAATPALFLPRGRVMDHSVTSVYEVYQQGVAESVAHAWYADGSAPDDLVRPTVGTTTPSYSGPVPPFTTLQGSDRYSWIKAPRFEGQPMEVGPLARVLVASSNGQREVRTALEAVVSKLGIGGDGLMSTLGRIIARAVEAQVVVRRLAGWHDELKANLATGDLAVVDVSRWDPSTWPSTAEGWSLGESARGAVGHWLSIRDGRIERYQIVDATTWNASPRDRTGWRGAIETALSGTPVVDPARPLEILRTVHSFDPCAACAVHLVDPSGEAPLGIGIHIREVAS